MSEIIAKITSLQNSDYYDNANLHIHTNLSDGTLTPQEVIEKAQELNLKYISITDHNTIEAYNTVKPGLYNNTELISGVEFDCWYKTNFIHIIGYGININDKNINKLCAKAKAGKTIDLVRICAGRRSANAIKCIKEAGGIAVLAHPACCWTLNLKKMISELKSQGLDGLEVYYPYKSHRKFIRFHSTKAIEQIADDLNLIKTGGADSHGTNLKDR